MKISILKISTLISCALLVLPTDEVHAQLLKKSSEKISAQKNISYTDIVQTKFSFQEESYADTLRSNIILATSKPISNGLYQVWGKNMSYAFDGNKMITLNALDSTFTVQKESVSGQNTRTLLHWAEKMRKLSEIPGNKILQVQDTIINGIPFSNVRVVESDTMENKEHHYNISNYVIDKKTDLPVQIVIKLKGNANDGTSFGLIEIHNYSQYKLNQINFPDLSTATIPSYYKSPTKKQPVKFLENGVLAPPLKAFDLTGQEIDLEKLKGKMVLINFSLIGCPHCVGAAQMLNRLHEKYENKNLVILNVYPIDKWEAIDKFDRKENVQTQSYTSDNTVKKSYPFDGYPSFYLLDRQGKVAQSYNGYYKELEAQLMQKIEAFL